MKPLLLRSLAALVWLGVFSSSQTYAAAKPHHPGKPNFAGSWILERKGSTSLQPLMQEIGAPFHERKLADVISLKSQHPPNRTRYDGRYPRPRLLLG